MPNSVLESMAHGVYTICSDIPAHRFIIGNDEFGHLFDKSDPSNLARLIIEFYKSPAPRIQQARKGRELIESTYSIQTIKYQILEMFNEVIQNK